MAKSDQKLRLLRGHYRDKVDDSINRRIGPIRLGYADAKASEALLRAKGTYVRPWDSAENYLKREAYALIALILDENGGKAAIQRLVRADREEPKSPKFEDNPFYWGLLHIFEFKCNFSVRQVVNHQPRVGSRNKKKTGLGKFAPEDRATISKISQYAPLLNYAYTHQIPAADLIGFLLQSGRRPAEARAMALAGQREDKFDLSLGQCHFPCTKPECVKAAKAEAARLEAVQLAGDDLGDTKDK